MSNVLDQLNPQLSEAFDEGKDTFVVDLDCDHKTFVREAIPFAVGYCGASHGLTDLSYMDKTMRFERVQE